MYFNNKHLLQKLFKNKSHWEASTLHNLQFARYFCMSIGYQMNVNHELGPSELSSGWRNYDMKHIWHLESIIVSRNISYWLDCFTELSSVVEVNKGDCFFVLSLCSKLRQESPTAEILEARRRNRRHKLYWLTNSTCRQKRSVSLRWKLLASFAMCANSICLSSGARI